MSPYRGLRAGDSVRFTVRAGGHDSKLIEVSAPVIRYLVFADHVVCKRGSFGCVVDDTNFIRIDRRSR
jgi:hypothetical protein